MTGKTGVARVALQTKCPVIPVGQWGATDALAPYSKKPDFFPRKTHHVLAGAPVDLSAYYDREITPDLLKEVTEVIMTAITAEVAELRGEKAPEKRYDPREARIQQRRKSQADKGSSASPAASGTTEESSK
jgi:1-acyl-sn-glycerol-3-phosphate acyltransferase